MSKALSLVAYNDLESQVEALERDGYVYFPNVLNAEEIAELRAMMDRLETIPECLDRHQVPQNGDGFLNKIINNSSDISQKLCESHSYQGSFGIIS